jgi:hypothetical protein
MQRRRNINLTIFCLLLSTTFLGQVTDFQFLVIQKGEKVKRINIHKQIYFKFSFDISGDSLAYGVREITGTPEMITTDLIELLSTNEEIITKDLNESSRTITTKFPPGISPSLLLRKEEITIMKYKSKSSETLNSLGYIFLGVGELTALFIAPLISINYSNGNFNKNLYYGCALTGIGMMGISIPLFIFGKEKKVILKYRNYENIVPWRFYSSESKSNNP